MQQAVLTLLEQLAVTAPLLMPEETLELEHEREGLWVQLTGAPQRWALRFVLTPALAQWPPPRALEGGWDAAASAAVAAALQGLNLPELIIDPA